MKRLGVAVAIFGAAAQLSLAQQSPQTGATGTAEALAKVRRPVPQVRDFSADFVQTYRGGALRTKSIERGTSKIRKPGLMRWL